MTNGTKAVFPLGGDLHVASEDMWDDMPEDRNAEIGAQAAAAIADAIQGRPVPGGESTGHLGNHLALSGRVVEAIRRR